MLKLWQEKETIQNIAWLVTEDTAWEVRSLLISLQAVAIIIHRLNQSQRFGKIYL